MKTVVWMGRSKSDLKMFPASVQDDVGHQLFKVQCGFEPSDWKPMPGIGATVKEIRLQDRTGAFRLIYLATRPDGVYVLHCFQKKTQKTSLQDLRLAQQRLKDVSR